MQKGIIRFLISIATSSEFPGNLSTGTFRELVTSKSSGSFIFFVCCLFRCAGSDRSILIIISENKLITKKWHQIGFKCGGWRIPSGTFHRSRGQYLTSTECTTYQRRHSIMSISQAVLNGEKYQLQKRTVILGISPGNPHYYKIETLERLFDLAGRTSEKVSLFYMIHLRELLLEYVSSTRMN